MIFDSKDTKTASRIDDEYDSDYSIANWQHIENNSFYRHYSLVPFDQVPAEIWQELSEGKNKRGQINAYPFL